MATWDEVYQRMGNGGMVPNAKGGGGDYQAQQLALAAAQGHIPGQGHRSQPGGIGGQGRWSGTSFVPPDQRGQPMPGPGGAVSPQAGAIAAALRGAQPGGMSNFGDSAVALPGGPYLSGQGSKPMPSMGGASGYGSQMPDWMGQMQQLQAQARQSLGGSSQTPTMGWEMGMPQQPSYQQPANPWALQPQAPQPSQWQGFNAGYSQQ